MKPAIIDVQIAEHLFCDFPDQPKTEQWKITTRCHREVRKLFVESPLERVPHPTSASMT